VRDRRFSQPLTLTTRVTSLFDARFILSGHLARNLLIDMGPSAVLRLGNVHIIVTSRSGPHFPPTCWFEVLPVKSLSFWYEVKNNNLVIHMAASIVCGWDDAYYDVLIQWK